MNTLLIRVEAPHFVAGLVFSGTGNGRVVRTAPILRKMQGITGDEARAFIRQRGWKATIVNPAGAATRAEGTSG